MPRLAYKTEKERKGAHAESQKRYWAKKREASKKAEGMQKQFNQEIEHLMHKIESFKAELLTVKEDLLTVKEGLLAIKAENAEIMKDLEDLCHEVTVLQKAEKEYRLWGKKENS